MAKTIKHYDFSKKPLRPSKFWMWLARNFAIRPRLKGRKVTVVKKNMEGIKPPYLLFVTHASMLDFPAMYTAVAPYDANNVVAIDAIRDVGDFLMRRLGCIAKRKFVKARSSVSIPRRATRLTERRDFCPILWGKCASS